jgi:quercetin dioxygenase-like cupin family protein
MRGVDTPDTDAILRIADGETITQKERREVVLLVDRADVSMTWSRYAPGERGTDLHVHREHTDAFYVLEGKLTFELGPDAERLALAAGGFVAIPPSVPHGFLNDGTADAAWLNFHAPDTGFADYMRGLRDGTKVPFDSFDWPVEGARPATEAILRGPGEGERLAHGLLKCDLPELAVAEWSGPQRPGTAYFPLRDDRVLAFQAPGGGLR